MNTNRSQPLPMKPML